MLCVRREQPVPDSECERTCQGSSSAGQQSNTKEEKLKINSSLNPVTASR